MKSVLRALSAIALLLFSPSNASHFPRGGIASGVTGNVNLGLAGSTYYSGYYPFIDVLKSASSINIQNSSVAGVQYDSSVPQGATDEYGNQSPFGTGGYLDNNGNFLSSLPSGTITYRRVVYSQTGGGPPNFVGVGFTVDWQGGSSGWTVTVTGTTSGTLASGTGTTPLSFTWPSADAQITLYITGSGANPPTQPRMYKTALQGTLNAGNYIDPTYLADVASASWSIRFMDWMNTNDDQVATSISNFPSILNASWVGGGKGYNAVNNQTAGIPIAVITSMATQANKHPWVNIPEGFVAPNLVQVQSITRSSTPTVTTYGPHNFVNGDTVIFGTLSGFSGPLLLNPSSYASSTFTTSGANSIANDTLVSFGILANGSTDSSTYPTGITKGTVYWTVNATSTSFQVAATPGGTALSLTGSMTGTINVLENGSGAGLSASTFGQMKILTSYSSSTFTLNNNGLAEQQPLVFGVNPVYPLNLNNSTDGTTYPTGITPLLTYYAKNVTTNTFQISASPGGAAITLSGSLIGTAHIYLKLAGNRFTVANVSGNTFQITGPGANTAGYIGSSQRQIVSGPGGVYPGEVMAPFNLTTMATNIGALVSTINSGVPSNIVPWYELANEIWNPQFSAWYTLQSQIPDPTQYQNSQPYITGYLMAAAAHAVYKSYGSANRSRYKFVFGDVQTCCDNQLPGPGGTIAGAQQYLTDSGSGLALTDLFDFLSVTSYMGANYAPNQTPLAVTFGTNTVAFANAAAGTPIKFNTNAPGGTLPSGLVAGTLGGSTYPSGSGTIYWLVGTGPNFGIATSPGGTALTFSGGSGSNTVTYCPEDVIQYLMAQSISLHNSNPTTYPNQWSFYDTATGDDVYNGKWTNGYYNQGFGSSPAAFGVLYNTQQYNYFTTNYLATGKPLAGLKLTAYEGGRNNNPQYGFQMINDPTWQSAYAYAEYGAGAAANFMQMYTTNVQTGLLAHQAQFVDIQALSINYGYGDYGAQQYLGDHNTRWNGIVTVNQLN